MKATSQPFSDSFDRFYMLGNIHKGQVVPNKEHPGQFFQYMEGRVVHLFAFVDGKVHIRYVPRENVAWLFDAYAE